MRDISANGLAKLATKDGNESVIIVEIQWTNGGSKMLYGDIDVPEEGVRGVIQEVGGLDNVITISGVSQGTTGDSQELSFTFDDIDGNLKNILDQNDIHKRPVWVYQWFRGLAFADKFLLFKGQVSSPLEWHETDRTVRFDVINQIEDAEVGFSIEEGDFDFVPEDLVGVAWPLLFGTNIHVKALQVRSPYKGVLKTGFGIHDFAKAAKLDQLKNTCCPLVFRGWHVRYTTSGGIADPVFANEPGCYCKKIADEAQWEAELELQRTYEFPSITIIGGDIFPQGVTIILDICGSRVTGKFAGSPTNPSTTFNVQNYEHPQFRVLTIPEVRHWSNCGARSFSSYTTYDYPGGAYRTRDQVLFAPIVCGEEPPDEAELGWQYLTTFPRADFFWAEPGCEVFYIGEDDIVYVVNLLPSTILRVAAWRTFDSGVRELVTVPSDLYTTRVSNFNGYLVQELVLTQLLSRRNEGWEDDLYVSSESSVGPNTVNILIWLIQKYTNFAIDATSFNLVKARLTVYPMAVPLLERSNILGVLKDIAFQARCALVLRNDTFFIRYLSEEPAADFTITEDDVLPGSLIITHTETEELVTKYIAEWIFDHSKDKPNKAIYRYNLKTYGTQEETFDFFAYNVLKLVRKSATFWLIRMANTWRKVKLKTPMTKLQAEVFDVANVTLSDLSPVSVKCIVEQATYDSAKFEMSFTLWTPIRSGETLPFNFAWPRNISVSLLWPTADDVNNGVAGGTGPNVQVRPPSSHPLAQPQGFTANFQDATNCGQIAGSVSDHLSNQCRADHGDTRPSDLDDTAPSIDVPGEGEVNIPTNKNPLGQEPSSISDLADDIEQNKAEQQETVKDMTLGQDGGDSTESGVPPDADDAMDDLPEENPLTECYVCLYFWMFETVTLVELAAGGTSNTPGDQGRMISGAGSSFTSACFNSLELSEAKGQEWTRQGTDSFDAIVGKPWPHISSLQEWGWNRGLCEEPDDEDKTIVSWGDRNGGDQDDLFKEAMTGGSGGGP
jgi:hypothetical protein